MAINLLPVLYGMEVHWAYNLVWHMDVSMADHFEYWDLMKYSQRAVAAVGVVAAWSNFWIRLSYRHF